MRYLSSQHFCTRIALRNSETASWSKVEVVFHKSAGRWPFRRQVYQVPSERASNGF